MPMTRIPLASSSSSEYRCIISQKWRYSASARRRVIALSTVWSPPCTSAYANTCSALQLSSASVSAMEARAEAMGRRAREEDGAAAVVRTVEAFLREKVATGEWRDDFQERVVAAYET